MSWPAAFATVGAVLVIALMVVALAYFGTKQ